MERFVRAAGRQDSRRARSRHPRGLASLALALLTLLLTGLGTAAHYKHHLDDPHCGADPLKHECVMCSSLHGGTLAASAPAAEVSAPLVRWVAPQPELALVARTPRGEATPRAPPIA